MYGILAYASNYSKPTRGLQYAAEVANIFASPLTAIFVSEPIVPLSPLGITPVPPEIYASVAQVVVEAQAAEPIFARWASSVGLERFRWQVATGYFSAALTAAANWHDALVLESGGTMPWNSVGMLGHALIHCGAPCFVVPDRHGKAACFDTIAIASHGSPESIRAVQSALPLLKRAQRIVLIKGTARDAFSPVDFRPVFSIEEHLRQHGLHFATRVLDAGDTDAGKAILAAASEANADLLVMGAYGRARFSEWMLGGATRHVLGHAALPVFVRH